jgi:hypothetical protein
VTTANVNIKKVLLRRGNTTQNDNYTGVFGEITVDTQVKTLRIHDGVTVGGNIVTASGAVGSYSNTNTAAYLASQSITSANIGAFQVYANANAASQTTEINSLRANITAANTVISGLTSNAAIQAALLDTLTGNAATQSTVLDTLTSNAATQTNTLTTLLANAVSQETSLISLLGNAATQATFINSRANLSGATFTGNVTVPYLFANNDVHIDGYVLVGSEHDRGVPYKNPAALFFGNTYYSGSDKYFQLNLQNTDPSGSGDIVITADDGTDSSNYITIGINGSSYLDPSFPNTPGNSPHDGYIYMTGGNLIMLSTDGNIVIGSNIGGSMSTNSVDNSWDISGNLTLANDILGQANNSSNLGADFAYFKNSYVGNVYATTITTGNILPSANVTYSLGSSTRQWRDLWVSNNTIYIGNTPIRVDGGTLLVNGAPVGGGYSNANVATYLPTYTGNIAGNIVKNGYTWIFGNTGNLTVPANGTITAPNAQEFQLQARDTNSLLRNEINLDPNNGTYMSVWSEELETSFSTSDWATGLWENLAGVPGISGAFFTNAENLQDFWTTGSGSFVNSVEVSINGGARLPVSYDGNNGETYGALLLLTGVPATSPTTITSLTFYYRTQSSIDIDYNVGEILLDAQSIDIDLRTTNNLDLRAGQNLNIRGTGQYPVRIYTDDTTHKWEFDNTGSLTLPREGKIYGIGDGVAAGDRYGYISWSGNSSGDGSGFNTMRLVPDLQGLEDLDQYIIIDPTGGVPGHIHIRAGGTQDNSLAHLYLGGENSHVKISAGANPPVTVMSNNNEWTFGTNGNLTIPGSINFTSSPAGSITGASLVSAQQFYSHGNVTIAGNLTVNGNSTIINTTSYTIEDNILQIADGNPADTLDLGFVGHRTVGNTLQHTGLVRDASAGNWKLFSNVTSQPGNTVDFTSAVYDDLVVGNISSPTVTDLYTNAATQATSINTINNTLTNTNVAIGYGAGATNQGGTTVAVGAFAGMDAQGLSAVAIGFNAGQTTQGTKSVAIGMTSGYSLQGNYAVAIGDSAGYTNQGAQAIAIGRFAGLTNQANNTIILNATGANLNATTANTFIVAPVRNDVANVAQVMFYNTTSKEITYGNTISVAGNISAGNISTRAITLTNGAVIKDNSGFGVSFGEYAGTIAQGAYAVAILGGYDRQGADAIAIGQAAGSQQQGTRAVAIGRTAGQNNQGDYAISIGWAAGTNNQPARTIILNGSGSAVNGIAAQTDSFYVAPVRNDVANVAQVMFYNTTSKEITYGNTISIAGNINANQYNFANGVNILSTVGAGAYGNTQVATYLLNFDGDIEFTSSVARIGNVDVITVGDHIRSPAYQFSNGVSILAGITATANTGNITFSDTTIGTAGGAGQGIILNSAGSGEIAMLDYVGINNTNPGYWLHVGDGSIGAINNTGNISIDYNNGLDSSRAATILGYAWWDAGSNGNNNRGIGAHRQFGIYKNDDLYTTKYIEFDLTSGNANLTNIAVTRVTTTNGIFWSNGTNILDGITGGGGTTYTDANVVSLLAANSSVFVGNTNNINTYSLQSNITQVFIGGNAAIASGNANVTNSTSLLHNMYFAANGTRLVRNTGAGVGLLSFDSTGFTVSGLVTVQTANSAPALPHWIKANVNGLFAPSGFTTSTITASGTVAVNATTGIQTNQTTFPLVNQTATTILFGGAATSINMGSATIGGSGSNVFVGNAIGTSSGNLTVRAFGTYNSVNSLTSSGGYGNTTYSNIAVTGGSGTGMIISMSGAASGYLASATVTNPGTGYRNGETITIPAGNPVGSLGGSFVIGNYNAAYLGQVLANYTFGIDGNLTLPGNVTIAGVGSIRYANGVNYASTIVGTYSNTNVEAYIGANIGAYQTFANANAATQATSINTVNANIGAYQTYANTTFTYSNTNVAAYLTTATITTTGNITAGNLTTTGTFTVANITTTGTYGNITGANVISANTVSATNYLFANGVNILSTVSVGSTYSNVNVEAYIGGNIGAYYAFANANAATQATSINTFNANLGAYQTYANANVVAIQANLGAYQTYANATFSSGASTYSNTNVAAYLTTATITTTGNVTAANIITSGATSGNISGANYISANAFQVTNGIFWSNGTAWSSAGGGTTYSNANVAAYLTAGNISVGTAGFTVLPNIVAQFTSNVNSYGQVNMQNINAGTDATTEIIATANNGTDTIFFVDMGIAGNTYDNTSPSNSLGTIIYANDAYLYAQGNTSANIGGNLAIGAATAGRSVTIFAGGINNSSNVATFANTGVTVYGNITAANVITSGTYGNITNANVIFANTVVGNNNNLTLSGNIIQLDAYFETYSNVVNSGGNLTLNFANTSVFYATLTANVTANIVGLANNISTVTGFTVIVDQGATPYRIANIQFNGGSTSNIKWAGTTVPTGTASNTDIISLSLINLGNGTYRVLGQQSSYG